MKNCWSAHNTETKNNRDFPKDPEEEHLPEAVGVLLLLQSILIYYFCVWFSSCTVAQNKALPRVAQKTMGCPLPTLEDLHS